MVYSMTGYGKGNLVLHGKDITVEVKSVNHRYFEYSSRMSRFFSFLDDKIKKEIQGMIARGKVEVSLMIRAVENSETKIEPDVLLAKSYYDALNTIADSTAKADSRLISIDAIVGGVYFCPSICRV